MRRMLRRPTLWPSVTTKARAKGPCFSEFSRCSFRTVEGVEVENCRAQHRFKAGLIEFDVKM
jgi:hypothetical protein